jgi:Tfp pilus assembly protein PilX
MEVAEGDGGFLEQAAQSSRHGGCVQPTLARDNSSGADPRSRRTDAGSSRKWQRGGVLIVVLAIVAAVLLIGVALFTLGGGETGIVERRVDSTRAFYLAEAGLDRAKAWLEALAQKDPPTFPDEANFGDQWLGGGEYDVEISKASTANPWLTMYDVVSTATVDGAVRQIRARLQNETFAQFVYFADETSEIWFTSRDSLDGRVHVNGVIYISGDPWFGMKVTSTANHFNMYSGSNPTFEGGYELSVGHIPLPMPAELAPTLVAESQSGGLYGGVLAGANAKYEVELGRGGNMGHLSYRAYRQVSGTYQWSGWTSVLISSMNGIAWFEEPIDIKGTLDGQLTVGSAGDINIMDNVLYLDSTPGHGPNPGCDDILGLVSAKNVVVWDSTPNLSDCEIHAHMIALDKSFGARNYDSGSPRGDLTVWGGFAQRKIGAIGQFRHGSGIIHGYSKNYNYDRRLMTNSPPGFPPTGQYIQATWEEVIPPEL